MLFGVGVAHGELWFGDILALYALCAPFVLLLRRLPVRALIAAGVLLALAGTMTAPLFQPAVGGSPAELGDLWFAGTDPMGPTVETSSCSTLRAGLWACC